MLRVVTDLPSLPANGPLLAMNCIVIVGSSTVISGRMRVDSIDVIVSPTFSSLIPVTATMSPVCASAISNRLSA